MSGTKTSFLLVHDARTLELVAEVDVEVDVEGALRLRRGVVGGGGDEEDTGGSGEGRMVPKVCLFVIITTRVMCVKSRKRGGVRGESVSVSHSFTLVFVDWK